MTLRYREIEKAARTLRVEVQALGVREPEDFAAAFATMTRRRPDAMFLVADALTNMNRKQFVEFAATNRIPGNVRVQRHRPRRRADLVRAQLRG